MLEDDNLSGICERLERIMQIRPIAADQVRRGYTSARRLIVEFADGQRAFVKVGSDPLTSGWLRDEYRIYQNLRAEFLPRLLGWQDDGESPLIVLEDLSTALWPSYWNRSMIDAVLETLARVRKAPPPSGLPLLESMRSMLTSWHLVALQPEQFLSLGLCSASWLESALPTLIEYESKAVLGGSELLHLDVRSDNLCFLNGRVVLVDWNWASVGNAMLDATFWLPSLRLEGGPLPGEIMAGEPSLVTLVAGFWAYRAGMPPPQPGSTVRELQRQQLEVALPWCADLLGLHPPQGTVFQTK